jgi:hypothetical protein
MESPAPLDLTYDSLSLRRGKKSGDVLLVSGRRGIEFNENGKSFAA